MARFCRVRVFGQYAVAPNARLPSRSSYTLKLWESLMRRDVEHLNAIDRLLMRLKLLNCRSRYGTASPAVFRGCGGNFEFHQGRRTAEFSAALAHASNP